MERNRRLTTNPIASCYLSNTLLIVHSLISLVTIPTGLVQVISLDKFISKVARVIGNMDGIRIQRPLVSGAFISETNASIRRAILSSFIVFAAVKHTLIQKMQLRSMMVYHWRVSAM